jgi:hypothetical protein
MRGPLRIQIDDEPAAHTALDEVVECARQLANGMVRAMSLSIGGLSSPASRRQVLALELRVRRVGRVDAEERSRRAG